MSNWTKINKKRKKNIGNSNSKQDQNNQKNTDDLLSPLSEIDIPYFDPNNRKCEYKDNLKYDEYLYCNAQNYFSFFDEAIKSEKIKNLAFIGEYGAGKSSVFKSFLRNFYKNSTRYKNNFLEIEIGEYNNNNKASEEDDFNQVRYIEKQILTQITSQVKSKKIKDSNYMLDLNKIQKRKMFLFVILILITIICWTIFSLTLNIFFQNHNKIESIKHQSFWNNIKLDWNLYNGWIITIILFGVIAIILTGLIFTLIVRYLNKMKINLSFFSQKIEMEIDKKNILHEMDMRISEILYVFKQLAKSGKCIYVFEDLDRFGNLIIFQKLKELNKTINNFLKNQGFLEKKVEFLKKLYWRWIKKSFYTNKVTFVYLINPNLFSEENKVKFFDLIIPIVQITSQAKAREFWIYKFHSINKLLFPSKDPYDYENNKERLKEYFAILSEWVYDIRKIYNILNEYTIYFIVYRDWDNNTYPTLNELFKILSFIVLKNIFQKEIKNIWTDISNKFIISFDDEIDNNYFYKLILDTALKIQNTKLNSWSHLSDVDLEVCIKNKEKNCLYKEVDNMKYSINIYPWFNYVLTYLNLNKKIGNKDIHWYLNIDSNKTIKKKENKLPDIMNTFAKKFFENIKKHTCFYFKFLRHNEFSDESDNEYDSEKIAYWQDNNLKSQNSKKPSDLPGNNLKSQNSKKPSDLPGNNLKSQNSKHFDLESLNSQSNEESHINYNRFREQLKKHNFNLSDKEIMKYLSLHSFDYKEKRKQYNEFDKLKKSFKNKLHEIQSTGSKETTEKFAKIISSRFGNIDENNKWSNKAVNDIDLAKIFYDLTILDLKEKDIFQDTNYDDMLSFWFFKWSMGHHSWDWVYNIFWLSHPFCQLLILLFAKEAGMWWYELQHKFSREQENEMNLHQINYFFIIIDSFLDIQDVSNVLKDKINNYYQQMIFFAETLKVK